MIRAARGADRGEIEALLLESKLPIQGVADHVGSFVVIEQDRRIVAVGGSERYGDAALLRSVAVVSDVQRSGLGSLVTRRVLSDLCALGVRSVYLLTTTAERFFSRFGFEVALREAVPRSLQASAELQGACPASAIVMRLVLRAA